MKRTSSFVTRRSVHDKIKNYLFNPDHKTGWPKGQWFIRALGFNPKDISHLHFLAQQIKYDEEKVQFLRLSSFGARYIQKISITGPAGKTIPNVRIIWQYEEDGNIALLTIMPPKD